MHGTLPKLPAKPPAQLRAATRARRAAPRHAVTHIALPGYEIARAAPRRQETITALLKRTGWARREEGHWRFRNGLPTILTINGEAVLRKRWRNTRIGIDDVVQFVSRPLGGQGGSTGKQVIGLVALVAVVAFAAWAGPLLAGAAGLGGVAWAGSAATFAIGIGGSLLINTLINPKAGATNDPNAKTDQIYTASATGNLPKLGQPLPVGYGREKVYPDFAATPWGEFVGNDQYQNILLSVGLGKYSYEQLYIDDTPLWDSVNGVAAGFSSAQIEFYDPNEEVTLFPSSVSSSSEVTGQQLPHGGGVIGHGPTGPGAWVGGYVSAPSGTLTQSIAVDIVFPAGCFWLDSKGRAQPLAVGFRAEYRQVNDAGAPIGGWSELFDEQRSYNSRSPIRDSIKIDVSPARYEVRLRRNDDVPASNDGASDIVWAGLRAYIKGANSFPVSTIAIRIKGAESTQGSFKFGAVRTRILPVWNGSAFVEQPTRNNAWAFFDAVTNTEYGSGHPISKADFNAIVAHAAGCHARGDHFDYTFSSATAVPEALDKILMPSRARHFWLGDVISLVRDEWRDVPSMLLTDREIVRDTTQISFSMLGEEDPDAVRLEYVDEETWRPAMVQYPPEVAGFGGFHATNAETKRLDGILNRAHAYRECAFLYLQSIYRRENVQIGTEYEGRAITFGSTLRVQSELPMAYGYGGAIVDRTGNALTLSPAPSWADAGAHYIRLRRPNGKFFGPVLVTRGATDAIAVLDAGQLATAVSAQGVTLSQVLTREDGGEDPSFDFGAADNQSRLCVVLSGQPNGSQCTLNLVVDDPRVHATDIGNPPVIPGGQFPINLTAPVVAGLNARFGQGVAEPKLSASWFPAAGAIYYVAEVSYDDGASWQQVYEGRDNKLDEVVQLAALTLRVQAVGAVHGPYSEIQLGAPTIELIPEIVGLRTLQEGIKAQVTTIFEGVVDGLNEQLNLIAGIVGNQASRNWIDKTEVRFQIASRTEAAFAQIENVRTVASEATAALAQEVTRLTTSVGELGSAVEINARSFSSFTTAFSAYTTSVSVAFGQLRASVVATSEAVVSINGQLAAAYTINVDNNGYVAGTKLVNGGPGASYFCVIADSFLVAQPGVAGGAFVPVFTIATVNGSAKLALRGDMIVDGSITTPTIAAGAVKTITLDAQAVTAEKMAANSVTAENGAIKNLSVDSIKIKDNAVTIPKGASLFPAQFYGGTSIPPDVVLTMSIDTAGSIGKTINISVQAGANVDTASISSGTRYLNFALYRSLDGGAAAFIASESVGAGAVKQVAAFYSDSIVGDGAVHTLRYYLRHVGNNAYVASQNLLAVGFIK